MSTLIARLKRRSTHLPPVNQHSQTHAPPATPIQHSMPGAWSELSPLQRKIHPDLNFLIARDATTILDTGPSKTASTVQNDTTLEFVPLLPSTRKRPTSQLVENPAQDREKVEILGQPSQDISSRANPTTKYPLIDENAHQHTQSYTPLTRTASLPEITSTPVDASSPNISGETFGRARNRSSPHGQEPGYINPDIRSIEPITPDTSSSQAGSGETADRSPQSRLNSPYKLGNPTSSPHTFGIPTPPSSGFAFSPHRHRIHAPRKTPPPLPPLDHPAFQSSSVSSNFNDSQVTHVFAVPGLLLEKDDQQPKHPRHASSLPSMSRRTLSSAKSTNRNRKRARTQSRGKAQEIFPSTPPLQSTPRRRFQHSRSQSKDSISSSRRASAEFSAAQAGSVGNGNGTAESWEAQVSREMVRISLREKPRAGYQNIAGVRGNGVYPSIKTPALGSPFLLQHTHNSPGGTRGPDDSTSESNITGLGNKGGGNLPTMSKSDAFRVSEVTAGPGNPKPPGRARTPSPPPPKISTIPYPGPQGPSTSYLMPPSLSFTAPTPEASPISPTQLPRHQQAVTEPPQSVLKPSTQPIVRSTSPSHKGKRKADEAGVEGGNTTPPKDQPRATFALEPRPHRASANSGSSQANSGSSRAPSSYHRKRVKLSTTPESHSGSRASVDAQNAGNTGSWSSKASSRHISQPPRPPPATYQQPHREPSRRSLSQASVPGSIPMSALISPHAPSIQGSSTFHMRDPRKPPPIQAASWSLSLPSGGSGSWVERGGSPLHAWLFFVGFLIFPIWWIAAFVGIPRTRRLGGNEVEKGVVLDDPQVEYDAKSWRKRCRILAVASLFTYIPFVILVAIFAR